MKCEMCPIQYQCPAYKNADKDNNNSYHPQTVVRVDTYDEPGCPLLKMIDKEGDEDEMPDSHF